MNFPTKHVLVTIANGAESIEEISIVDALRRSNGLEVTLAKVDHEKDDKNSLMNKMNFEKYENLLIFHAWMSDRGLAK